MGLVRPFSLGAGGIQAVALDVQEITVASPFSSMLIFFRDRLDYLSISPLKQTHNKVGGVPRETVISCSRDGAGVRFESKREGR
jgi:hypothetical protein